MYCIVEVKHVKFEIILQHFHFSQNTLSYALSGRDLFFLIIKLTLQDTYYNKYIHFTQGACDPTFENEQNNNPIF